MEFTSINVDNKAHNVIPARARAQFNIRYNNLHTSRTLKKKVSLIVKKMSKKNKCSYKIDYMANGDAFLTKPVRSMVGCLEKLSSSEWSLKKFKEVLKSKKFQDQYFIYHVVDVLKNPRITNSLSNPLSKI